MPKILISGCSSGFGLEIARHFAAQRWNVVATMRTPRDDLFSASDNIRVLPLDVTDDASIAEAVAEAGPVDALVNNAGIGYLNALEETPIDAIRDVFETNAVGTIAMTQAVLPQMRERGAGVVVNVTSSVTYRSLPLLSVYTASKAAVNAFSASVALELEPFGVRVRVVRPGRAPDTSFATNARARMAAVPDAYGDIMQRVMDNFQHNTGPVTSAQDVADAVWNVVTDTTSSADVPAGADAEAWSQTA
jgi:NAD(P)-dependent dehydrogenase (short-subunit alcohol dehydrogenase family)